MCYKAAFCYARLSLFLSEVKSSPDTIATVSSCCCCRHRRRHRCRCFCTHFIYLFFRYSHCAFFSPTAMFSSSSLIANVIRAMPLAKNAFWSVCVYIFIYLNVVHSGSTACSLSISSVNARRK